MKNFSRFLGLFLFTASFAFGVYVLSFQEKERVVIHLNADPTSFQNVLIEGLEIVAHHKIASGNAKIVIHLPGSEVVARLKIKDLQKLMTNQVNFDQFMRSYILFS